MQIGIAVLHLYAESGQGKKCIVALSCFEFQKKPQKINKYIREISLYP